MQRRTFALVVLSAVTFVTAAYGPVATGRSEQPRTTDPSLLVNVRVTITDAQISLDRHTMPRGAAGRFFVRNTGTRAHDFTLAGNHVLLYPVKVKPKTQKILLVYFDYRGALSYRSSLPYDRSKPGMKGTFTVV